MRRIGPLALAFLGATLPSPAAAKPELDRQGGQWGVLLGAAACIPGKAKCRAGISSDAPGRTRTSFGLGAELGYRWQYVFLGAAYNLGLMRPDFDVSNAPSFSSAYQNSVFGVIRPVLPVWRFDFGVDVGAGFARQTFKRQQGDREYTQGLTFKLAPTVDIFVSKRFFLGAKLDMILNAHGQTCVKTGGTTLCEKTRATDRAGVHQMIVGLHLGSTFL